jgi:aryl-alcohol dehydrogenase-like predicted oxidoreductase
MTKNTRLVLGTVQFGLKYGINNFNGKPSKEKSLEMLGKAYDSGIKIFDTAFAYGDAEDILGEFITRRKLENKVEIISKLKPNILEESKETGKSVKDIIVDAVKESLRRLKIKKLDGYLLHTPKYIYNKEVVEAMQLIKKQGFVRNIGVSIYDEEDAIYAAKSKLFDYIQVPYSVFDQRLDKTDFFEIARQNKVTVFARSAFLQGLIFMEDNKVPVHLSHAIKYLKEFDKSIGKYNLSRLQASLLFSYLNNDFSFVVFGVDNIDQLEQDIKIIENIKLKDDAKIRGCIKELKAKLSNIEKSIVMPSLWKKD